MKRLLSIIVIVLAVSMVMLMPTTKDLVFCYKKITKADEKQSVDLKQTLDLEAKSSILMDAKTGNVLYSDNKDTKLAPASMTKVMTMLLVMEEIEKGNLSLNQNVVISDYSASMDGSECFLDANKEYSIYELIKSVAVASANDSCVALAESVSGDEKIFVNKMNEKAKSLGMGNTHFVNCTGLDEDDHYSTASDLCIALKALSKYSFISELEKTWTYDMKHSAGRITSLTNTNRLVRTNQDIVMAKTGHTDNAGFCIVALAKRGDTELLSCVMGLETSNKRFEEITKLLNYGFSNYENKIILNAGESVGEIKIKNGKQNKIEVFPKNDLSILQSKDEPNENYQIVYNYYESEYMAPLNSGDVVGEVKVLKNGKLIIKEELVVKNSVDEKTLKGIITQLIEGWFQKTRNIKN